MAVTDVHNHAIPQGVLDLITSDPAYEVKIVDGVWSSRNQGPFPMIEAWTSPEAKLAELDSKGLDRAILSVAPKPLFFYDLPLDKQLAVTEASNQGLADFCSGNEDRLGWMAHVPLAFPERAAQVVRDAVAMGARGVELGTSAMGRRLDDPGYEVLWDAIGPVELPILLHPAYESTGPEAQGYGLAGVLGLPYEITNALVRLICGHVLDRHPRLRIIATLGGGFFPYVIGRLHHYSTFVPELADAPRDPWSYVGQIKFDTHLHDSVALRYLIERAGIENILVGTDCSFLSQTGDPIKELSDAVGGDADAARQIAEVNAEPFWNAGAGVAVAPGESE